MNYHNFIFAGGSDDHGDGAGHGGAAERGRVPHPHRGLASGQVDSISGGLWIYPWYLSRFRTAINLLGDSIGAGIVDYLSKDDLQAMEDEESKTDVLDEPKQNGGNFKLETSHTSYQ